MGSLKTRSKLTCRDAYRTHLLEQKNRLRHIKTAMTHQFPYLIMSLQEIFCGKFRASSFCIVHLQIWSARSLGAAGPTPVITAKCKEWVNSSLSFHLNGRLNQKKKQVYIKKYSRQHHYLMLFYGPISCDTAFLPLTIGPHLHHIKRSTLHLFTWGGR